MIAQVWGLMALRLGDSEVSQSVSQLVSQSGEPPPPSLSSLWRAAQQVLPLNHTAQAERMKGWAEEASKACQGKVNLEVGMITQLASPHSSPA
jgi:hypothetical protein